MDEIKEFLVGSTDFEYNNMPLSHGDDFGATRINEEGKKKYCLTVRFSKPDFARARNIIENRFEKIEVKERNENSMLICTPMP
jgi:hypothetical protein